MLEDMKLVAIIREVEPEQVSGIVRVLLEEGIHSLEISLSGEEMGFGCLERIQKEFAGEMLQLGAGTVTEMAQVNRLSDMGISFLLTPGYDDEIVSYALSMGIEVLPGVLTPTEVQQALKRGITRMKLFPADAYGMNYIKSLKGPFPQAEFVAVGGVREDNIKEFLRMGFQGVAIGSNLVPKRAGEKDLEEIRARACAYVLAVNEG